MYQFLLNVLLPLLLLSSLLRRLLSKILTFRQNKNMHPFFNNWSRIVWCLKTLRKILQEDSANNLINYCRYLEINGTIFWCKNLSFSPHMLFIQYATTTKKNGSNIMIRSIEIERNLDSIDFLSTQQPLHLYLYPWNNFRPAVLW